VISRCTDDILLTVKKAGIMSISEEIYALSKSRVTQTVALIVLLSAAAWQEIQRPSIVAELDIWWHMAVGDWILKNHSCPDVGILSQYAMQPWAAYSWGFELLVSRFFAFGGLAGLLLFLISLEVFITYALFRVLLRISGDFWAAWVLAGLGIWALYHNMPIRPVLFSLLFFTLTIGLIFAARRRGSMRPLYWLPPLFLLWANLHIQFVYGLALVGIVVVLRLVQAILAKMEWRWPHDEQEADLPLLPLAAIGAGCALATIVGPYGVGLYGVISEYAGARFVYAHITEMSALDFHASAHYVQLLITAAAFFALGRRSKDPYKFTLLLIATLYGYRMTRDSWFACIPALVLIASTFRERRVLSKAAASAGRVRDLAAFAGAVLVLLLAWRSAGVTQPSLHEAMTALFPVRAADYIRREKLPGPLYNNLNYGGFLAWYLPEHPVAIDGRTDLYGEEIAERFNKVLMGYSDPAKDPDMIQANVILLQKGYPLCTSLLSDRKFRLVYQDHNAYVFVKNQ
jgi:hypothetical protein